MINYTVPASESTSASGVHADADFFPRGRPRFLEDRSGFIAGNLEHSPVSLLKSNQVD